MMGSGCLVQQVMLEHKHLNDQKPSWKSLPDITKTMIIETMYLGTVEVNLDRPPTAPDGAFSSTGYNGNCSVPINCRTLVFAAATSTLVCHCETAQQQRS